MQINKNTILITGGSAGIGLAIAKKFNELGNTVIITGRNEEKLKQVKELMPDIHTIASDVTHPADRQALVETIQKDFPNLNILVNNAGIKRIVDFTKDHEYNQDIENVVNTNITAPFELTKIMMPQLLKQADAAIVNITSGLAIVPVSLFPVYCASKTAMHSFSISLRDQLKDTAVKVFDIMPPSVDTYLNKGVNTEFAVTPAEVAKILLDAMNKNKYEVKIADIKKLSFLYRLSPKLAFKIVNKRFKK